MLSRPRQIEDEVVDDSELEWEPPLRRQPSKQAEPRRMPPGGFTGLDRVVCPPTSNIDLNTSLAFEHSHPSGALCFIRGVFSWLIDHLRQVPLAVRIQQ